MGKFFDLTGETFGKWKVIKEARRENGKIYWLCECECGSVSEVLSYSLRSGGSKSCGYCGVSKKLEDLTGCRYHDWTVLNYSKEKNKWLCRCDCGELRYVAAYDLKKGKTRNCGHNRKKPYKDLTGKIFGYLTVESYIGSGKYKCRCICGQMKSIYGGNLSGGNCISCGCKQATEYTKEKLEGVLKGYGKKVYLSDFAKDLGLGEYYTRKLVKSYGLERYLNKKFRSRIRRNTGKINTRRTS